MLLKDVIERKDNDVLRICTINARSIKKKDIQIAADIEHLDIDVALITETWLNTDNVIQISSSSALNQDGLHMDTASRPKVGGGLALVTRGDIIFKKIKEQVLTSFQFGLWTFLVNTTTSLHSGTSTFI